MDIYAVLANYCGLMESVKVRTDLMLGLLGNQRELPPFCVAEILQLQIRMICETLAVACLVAHGDLEGTRSARLTSAYQADFIMNALEKLHPRFFPRSTRQILHNGKPIAIENIKDGFLSKAELLKSYHDAANFLHAGTISDLSANRSKEVDTEFVKDWVQKLIVLLNHHTIYLADPHDAWDGKEPLRFADGEPAPKRQITVLMRTEPHSRPAATIFESIGLAPKLPEP